MKHKVEFTNGTVVELNSGESFAENTDILQSPIDFACKKGLCSTCIVKIHEGMNNICQMTSDEKDTLALHTKDPSARLACKLTITGNIKLEFIGK